MASELKLKRPFLDLEEEDFIDFMIGTEEKNKYDFGNLFENENEEEEKEESDILPSKKKLHTEEEEIDKNQDAIVRGKKPFVLCIFGPPGQGKTQLAKYVTVDMWNKRAFDYAIVVSTTDFNDDWSFLPKKSHKRWSEKLRKKIIEVQTNPERGRLLLILEDQAGTFPWDTNVIASFISCYRHYNLKIIICMQYVNLVPPIIRECAGIAVMFKQVTDISRQELYKSYGMNYGDKKEFYSYLDENTGDYWFILYDARIYTWEVKKIPKFKIRDGLIKF